MIRARVFALSRRSFRAAALSAPIHAQPLAMCGWNTSTRGAGFSTIHAPPTSPKVQPRRRWKLYTSKKEREATESRDISQCVAFSQVFSTLKNLPLTFDHPVHSIATSLKASITTAQPSTHHVMIAALTTALKSTYEHLSPHFDTFDPLATDSSDSLRKAEALVRVKNLMGYVVQLDRAVIEGEMEITADLATKYSRLVDAFMMGSGSERLSEHMRLYKPMLQKQQLVEAFNRFYDSEVSTCADLFCHFKRLDKPYVRKVRKLSNTYLLDKLELNTKARSVFAWSDESNTFSNYKSPEEDHQVSIEDLLQSRRLHFKEGEDMAGTLMKDITAERRILYYDRSENREQRFYGYIFFCLTMVLDTIVVVV